MIGLAVIIPLALYFVLATWLFDKYYWGTNTRLRKWLRRGVLSLPFLDVIIGFIIFGLLCLFSGGAHIYNTVDDVEAQKVYWFHKEFVFTDSKNTYSEKEIEIDNLGAPLYVGGIRNSYELRDKEPVKSLGYINYCRAKYDNLPASDSNYLRSCKYTDKIIKQYAIQNVIKPPPRSPYYHQYADDVEFSLGFFEFLRVQKKITNQETNQVLAVHNTYGAGGGWFFRLLASFLYLGEGGMGGECCRGSSIAFQESVIPNPYKQQENIASLKGNNDG